MERDTDQLKSPAIVWFRSDLRIADNEALSAASDHASLIPVFIRETESGARPLGAARQWWLHHSLERLAADLEELGTRLILLSGKSVDLIRGLVSETGASAVYWNRRYDPALTDKDAALKAELQSDDLLAESFPGQLLHEPTRLRTTSGTFYKVYSPFWRAIEADIEDRPPLDAPASLKAFADISKLGSEKLADWNLLPTKPDWSQGIREVWTPGAAGARERLAEFLEDRLNGYAERRDLPGVDATSGLSPHLANGEISPAQIIEAMKDADTNASSDDRTTFRKEVGWREFSWHLLVNEPELATQNHNSRFNEFPWLNDDNALSAWQKGQTGYPIVDAGMRQLWQTGWMHNRIRMVVASFLTKHLMIDWRKGEEWFWDTLVDADPPQTRQAGNGSPVQAPMPRPISGSSIRCSRARTSTLTETMCADLCPNWKRCRQSTSTNRGTRPTRFSKPLAFPSATHTLHRLSTISGRASARWRPISRSRMPHERSHETLSGHHDPQAP
jgi:deoxyribodipyrimidine photo-lyase